MREWQPIAIAPKGGVLVLLFDPVYGRVTGYNVQGVRWLPPEYGGEVDGRDIWRLGYHGIGEPTPSDVDDGSHDHEPIDLLPTHWQPLPEPPHA